MTGTSKSFLAISLSAVVLAPVAAVAASGGHASPARPAAGTWKLDKTYTDHLEKKVTWHVTHGGKAITKFAFTPTGNCAGPRITVQGPKVIKKGGSGKHASYYVGGTRTTSTTVTLSNGDTTTQAGLIVNFTDAKNASVTLSGGTAFCTISFGMKR